MTSANVMVMPARLPPDRLHVDVAVVGRERRDCCRRSRPCRGPSCCRWSDRSDRTTSSAAGAVAVEVDGRRVGRDWACGRCPASPGSAACDRRSFAAAGCPDPRTRPLRWATGPSHWRRICSSSGSAGPDHGQRIDEIVVAGEDRDGRSALIVREDRFPTACRPSFSWASRWLAAPSGVGIEVRVGQVDDQVVGVARRNRVDRFDAVVGHAGRVAEREPAVVGRSGRWSVSGSVRPVMSMFSSSPGATMGAKP